jgi:flagellar hook-associated protein 2
MTTGPVNFTGLISGLNTTSIISAEMAIYEQPLNALKTQQTNLNTQLSDLQALYGQVLTLQQAGDALAFPSAYTQAYAATSSDASTATATVTSAAQTGSVTLAVDQLATGSTAISSGTVAATNDVVAAGDLLLGTGGAALGIQGFAGTSGLATGAHTITVTQSSSGATVTGTAAPAATTTITSANDTLDVTVGGTAQTVTLAAGTYTAGALAQAVTTASGGTLTASVGATGLLSVATTQQGSSATLQVTGGTALGALGLAAGAAVTGTDGVVTVDGTATTVTDIAGTGTTTVALASGTGGTVNALLSGPLQAGTMTATNLSVGDGSLGAVVAAVNGAGLGITANALQVGTDQYALDLSSTKTGTVGGATIDTQAFATSGLGTMTTTSAAQNAVVSIGGVGGYQVTSQTNTLTGVLPGVSIDLQQASTSPVTISVTPDGTQLASTVQSLVDAANAVLSTISTDTSYDNQTGAAGPLNGNPELTGLAQQVLAVVGNAVGNSAAGSDGTAGESAGLAITSSGTITFNQTAFEAAYAANPSAVQSLFAQAGTFTAASTALDGTVSLVGSSDDTTPGSYAISVSQSATKAVDAGSATFASGAATLASAETYTVTSGTSTASYAATAGESVTDVIDGLNTALATAGIQVSAALTGTAGSQQVQLASADYGSASSFSVATTGSDQLGLTGSGATFTGTDVVGTIDGQAATGAGQILTLEGGTTGADGLAVQVTATGITSATSLGTLSFTPGAAQSLAHLAKTAVLPSNGSLSLSITGLKSTLSEVGLEISQQQQLVDTQQTALTQEFANLESTLAKLNSESSFLTSQANASSSSSSSSSSGSGLSNANTSGG